MVDALLALPRDHTIALVAAALCVCIVASWLLLALLERASDSAGMVRWQWTAGAALVGGLGVWVTHFIAALGFRPDFAFSFDPQITAWSALIGVGAVGIPASATALTRCRSLKIAGGALAGAGIVVMHSAGMSALTNCIVDQSQAAAVAMALVGAVLFGVAFAPFGRRRRSMTVAMIVSAVCVVHFGLVAATSITPVSDSWMGIGQTGLGLFVGTVALCLFLAAGVVVNSSTKLAEQARQKALISAALTNMSNGLLLVGPNGRIELFNDRLIALFDIEPSAVAVGMRWQTFLANLAPRLGWNAARLARVIDNHALWFAQAETTYLEHALDDGRTISVACRPMAGGGAVLTYDDVTAERRAQKEVERLAFQDPLTGLPNRRTFQTTLGAVFEEGSAATLLMIDLDRFKTVNDTMGHSAADVLLIEVGRRLIAICNRGELVARLASDEFAVIVPSTHGDRVVQLCEDIVAALVEPFAIDARAVTIGCSIGIASTQDASSAGAIIQYADLGLYKAKASGRGRCQHYEPGMQEAVVRRSLLEADLRCALQGDQFTLLYQPLYGLDEGSVIGFEALIRWSHPTKGIVSPCEFIPVAEETGLIREIGLWIVREACQQIRNWPPDIHVAINVSPVQLRSGAFPLQVASALKEAGLAPCRLEIELTETALVEDSQQIAASLRALREFGIRVAMDDFGTGYSSFAHLKDFDLDWIKIDRSFVQAAPSDPGAAVVLNAVVQMARGLGVRTIGEGVETGEQLDFLKRAGCTAAQGFLLGRPMTGAQASALCEATGDRSASPPGSLNLAGG